MNNENRPLTPKIAEALIQELFAGQTAKLGDIIEKVDAVHVERGGQSSTAQYHPVQRALGNMKKQSRVGSGGQGFWVIFSEGVGESDESEDSSETPRIESLEAFVKWVKGLPPGKYVYRGVSNKGYPIEASAYRRLKRDGRFKWDSDKSAKALLEINLDLIMEAERHRQGWESDRAPSNLDLLAKLQHIGAATCLIDFTRNPLVALWMACRESSSGAVDGKVYAIDIGPGSDFRLVSPDEALKQGIAYFFKEDQTSGYQLYYWQPHYQESRMLAQQSIFLFGGGWGAIEASKECEILARDKQKISDSLRTSAGISEDILFPDFQGFASQHAANKPYSRIDPGSDGLPEGGANEADSSESQRLSFARYYLDFSLQAYQEGKTEVAFQFYTVAMEFNPSDEDLNSFYRERATFFFNKGYFESAIYDYDELIRLDSEDEDSYFWRGRSKLLLEKYKEAISDFDGAIGINPDVNYHYWRGFAKYHSNEYEGAILDFSTAIALDPRNANFRCWRGMARYNLNGYEGAILDFSAAIRLDPSNGYFHYWRGLTKYRQREYEGAILDFDDAITLSSIDVHSNGYSYYWRGMAKKELNLFGAARNDFRMAMICAEEVEDYNLQSLVRQDLG